MLVCKYWHELQSSLGASSYQRKSYEWMDEEDFADKKFRTSTGTAENTSDSKSGMPLPSFTNDIMSLEQVTFFPQKIRHHGRS